ncbi:replicative helicase loader/inhibitor [Paenibacillus sp. M2]|uniref:replicative helicase loader/inhibitor n=1 Tax=Paenibacillus sp. M2 TaxID=3341793 RepID=UPI0039899BD0
MNNQQVLSILAVVVTAYPIVELSDEMVTLWERMLEDVPFSQAEQNLSHHIKTSHFPPMISQIRGNPTASNIDQLRSETQERLALMESWEKSAVPLLKEGEPNG